MNMTLYRALMALLPYRARPFEGEKSIRKALVRARVTGATIAVEQGGQTRMYCYGDARKGVPCTQDTVYRVASVSKHVSAYGALVCAQKGLLDLDCDIGQYLGYRVSRGDMPVTARAILSHTSGIIDSAYYLHSLSGERPPLRALLDEGERGAPGAFCYSNLAFGLLGSVLEAATGVEFDALMQREVFSPLRIRATYHAQEAGQTLADARRILPPARVPGFDAAKRLVQKAPDTAPDPEYHYLFSHGSLCISAPELLKLARVLREDGEIQRAMRVPQASFGASAPALQMGLGTFIVNDASIFPRALYGHQGLAYGAVHGLFYDTVTGDTLAYLTSGASEARTGVLSDGNKAMMRAVFGK